MRLLALVNGLTVMVNVVSYRILERVVLVGELGTGEMFEIAVEDLSGYFSVET